MTVNAEPNTLPANMARVGTALPYHENFSERIILGITTLFDEIRGLETLKPDPINGRLFNQLFDLVTMSKTTTVQEEQVNHTGNDTDHLPTHLDHSLTLGRFWLIPGYRALYLNFVRSGVMPSTSWSSTLPARSPPPRHQRRKAARSGRRSPTWANTGSLPAWR